VIKAYPSSIDKAPKSIGSIPKLPIHHCSAE